MARKAVTTDRAVRARASGKQDVASRIVWSLEFSGAKVRCLREGNGYRMQVKLAGQTWCSLVPATTEDAPSTLPPVTLLRRLVYSKIVALQLGGES